jgi:hypothetical protein
LTSERSAKISVTADGTIVAERDGDVVAAVLGLDGGDRAVEHLVAVGDDADGVAELLGVLH